MQGVRVLIVDDFEEWRREVGRILQQDRTFTVVGEASTGIEGVIRAQELQPDVVLLDIGLPQLNGIEAARRISKVSPASKIIFVTSNASTELREEALRAGGRAYVLKSSAGSELSRIVTSVMKSTV